jgi:hypothetical protein
MALCRLAFFMINTGRRIKYGVLAGRCYFGLLFFCLYSTSGDCAEQVTNFTIYSGEPLERSERGGLALKERSDAIAS